MNDTVLKPTLVIRQYTQLHPYADLFDEMKTLTNERDADTPDQLWILQHQPVLTQGQGKARTYLAANRHSCGSI